MSKLFHRLKSLYVLDVILQTGSFSQAAEKLYITQSAVSQHIKQLEDDLGPLFIRKTRALQPTGQAEHLRSSLKRGFSELEYGWDQAKQPNQKTLTISVLPSFASNWLIQRLNRFSEQHPDIELRLSMTELQVDFDRTNIDAGIRYGSGGYPDLIVKHLMDDSIFPVMNCSHQQSLTLDDLTEHVLIRDNSANYFNWEGWLELANRPDLQPKRYLTISDGSLVIKAATAGQGIALGRRSLVQDELTSGILCQPFPQEMKSPFSYYLVMPPRSRDHEELKLFTEWLMQEISLFNNLSTHPNRINEPTL
jgi:LysR family transcriptional regulator, glycine cleavage system transcriptional activator